MNPDILQPGERCASTSNRNFEGRQGAGGRTHLVSPQMAAAAAIAGRFADVQGAGMRELRQVTGRAAMLDRADVDTDQIIPKQFLKRIERSGYGEFLFYDWMKDPDFELHRPEYEGAQILVAGAQLRAAAPRASTRAWALEDYGFRVILAPSYSDIFRSNAVKSGPRAARAVRGRASTQIKAAVAERNELTVDLETREITHPNGLRVPIELDEYARETLVHGLDDVARTLRREERIAAYEAATPARLDTRLARLSAQRRRRRRQ